MRLLLLLPLLAAAAHVRETATNIGPETATNFAGYVDVHNSSRHLFFWWVFGLAAELCYASFRACILGVC